MPAARRLPRLSAELREREAVRPLELFFDLVDGLPALVTLAIVDVAFWLMIAYEYSTYDERRYLLRHGLEVEVPR